MLPQLQDVVIAKSRYLEVRQLMNTDSDETATLPIVLSAPINGRITTMLPFRHPSSETDYIFFTTEARQYAVISYVPPSSADSTSTPYNLITHVSGDLADYGLAIRGSEPESGPIAALEPNHKCIALHLYEGFVTILPIHKSYRYKPVPPSYNTTTATATAKTKRTNAWEFLGPPFHCRIEERDVFSMTFLLSNDNNTVDKFMPQLAFLHQDSRGNQHVVAHSIDLAEKTLVLHSSVAPLGSNGTKSIVPPLVQHRIKKSRVDGSSGLIIAVPPVGWKGQYGSNNGKPSSFELQSMTTSVADADVSSFGGVLILGERQITYHNTAMNVTTILPIAQFVTLSFVHVHPLITHTPATDQDVVRYLLGDEEGRIHILAVARATEDNSIGLHLETLGVANISSSLLYLEKGLVFVGSQTADSQFIQILDEPVPVSGSAGIDDNDALLDGKNVTHINVLDEYTNLGPIVDFDMIPTSHNSYGLASARNRQFMAVTASGTEKDGSIRFVRNGIGMIEHASVELGGIKGMWNVRKSFHDVDDAFLIQSYVGETRILGVVADDDDVEDASDGSATLEEVDITGFDSSRTTLFAGNVFVDSESDLSLMIQITEGEIRLISLMALQCLVTWRPENNGLITVASANESGQIAVVLRGGKLVYLQIEQDDVAYFKINRFGYSDLGQEISCIDLNPFDLIDEKISSEVNEEMEVEMDASMEIDRDEVTKRRVVKSKLIAVGLWDESSVHLLSLDNLSPLKNLCSVDMGCDSSKKGGDGAGGRQMMARSVCLVTLGSSSPTSGPSGSSNQISSGQKGRGTRLNMMLIGLGDGNLISFVINQGDDERDGKWSASSRKEVSIGTRALSLVPFANHTDRGTCVLATGDRPTVVYLSGGSSSSSKSARLCYSTIHLSTDEDSEDGRSSPTNTKGSLVVNVASPFHSSLLFDTSSPRNYSLCISDDSMLRLGMIDDIQKLHVTTHKLGMPPRRVTYDENSRLLCVGCIDNGVSGSNRNGETNMGNCIRFFDDSTFEEIDRFDLNPYELILSMVCTRLKVVNDESPSDDVNESESQDMYRPFLVIGTAYGYPEEDEPSRGRIIVLKCSVDSNSNAFSRKVKQVAEVEVKGGVYSISPFYDGSILASINSKTRLCRLIGGSNTNDALDLKIVGAGHHGHLMSLHVRSLAPDQAGFSDTKREQLAIIGDMVRSISVVKYYPEFQTLEEIARDFNQNWMTAIEMLTDDVYLGAENFNNIFALRRNPHSSSEEIRCRLDTVGLFNLGEMINKFMRGSLVVLNNSSAAASNAPESHATDSICDDGKVGGRKLALGIGSRTLFATVDGTLGAIIGLDSRSIAFFSALQRAMVRIVNPVGNLKHGDFRSHRGQRSRQASRGFIDGDLVESFSELDPVTMDIIVKDMNKEGKWDISNMTANDESKNEETQKVLTVDDVLCIVEDMSMAH